MLKTMGVTKIRLLANNPAKAAAMAEFGSEVVEVVPTQHYLNPHNEAYLAAKARAGHAFSPDRVSEAPELDQLSTTAQEALEGVPEAQRAVFASILRSKEARIEAMAEELELLQ